MLVNNQTSVSEVLLDCESNLKNLRKLYVEDLEDLNGNDEQNEILNDIIKSNIDRIETAIKQLKKIK
jgi:hypothetical protein